MQVRLRKTVRIALIVSTMLALVVVVGGWLVFSSQRVTEAQFDQLRKGMSDSEVEEVLHGPGTVFEEWVGQRDVAIIDEHGLTGIRVWQQSGRTIIVEFVRGGVTQIVFAEAPIEERVRAWYRGDDQVRLLYGMSNPESPIRVRTIDFRKKA